MLVYTNNTLFLGDEKYSMPVEGYTGEIELLQNGYVTGESEFISYTQYEYPNLYSLQHKFITIILRVKDGKFEFMYSIKNWTLKPYGFMKGLSKFEYIDTWNITGLLYYDGKQIKKVYTSGSYTDVLNYSVFFKSFFANTIDFLPKYSANDAFIQKWTGKKFVTIQHFDSRVIYYITKNIILVNYKFYRIEPTGVIELPIGFKLNEDFFNVFRFAPSWIINNLNRDKEVDEEFIEQLKKQNNLKKYMRLVNEIDIISKYTYIERKLMFRIKRSEI